MAAYFKVKNKFKLFVCAKLAQLYFFPLQNVKHVTLVRALMDCSSSSYIEKQCCVPRAAKVTYCLQLELKSQDEGFFAIQKEALYF